MDTQIISGRVESRSPKLSGFRPRISLVLGLWLLLVMSLGALGAFTGRPGQPPLAIALGVAAPLLIFFTWLRLSPSFREFILSLDLRLVSGMQAWRWAGLGFLFLFAYRILPGFFALPAGLGDMAVGITAPWMIFGLIRRPAFAGSAAFVRWNLLGILDLTVAVGLGGVGAMLGAGGPGGASTSAMASLPLVLVPAFLVPFFLILHAVALMQSRRIRGATS
jgi:hypothetical protein